MGGSGLTPVLILLVENSAVFLDPSRCYTAGRGGFFGQARNLVGHHPLKEVNIQEEMFGFWGAVLGIENLIAPFSLSWIGSERDLRKICRWLNPLTGIRFRSELGQL
jgi:hypothetical protein